MTRSELAKLISADNPKLSLTEVEILVTTFFDVITARLVEGGRVEIRGFGTFETRDRAARSGRDPSNGKAVWVEAKRKLHFRPGKELRERVAAKPD